MTYRRHGRRRPLLSGTNVASGRVAPLRRYASYPAWEERGLGVRFASSDWRGVEQVIQRSAREQLPANDGKNDRRPMGDHELCLGKADQQISDQGGGDLRADGVLGGAHEAGDAQVLL